MNELREETLARFNLKKAYLEAFEEAEGTQNFLNGYQNYPVLRGTQSNLYKCFLPQAWMIGKENRCLRLSSSGRVCMTIRRGGGFREALYWKASVRIFNFKMNLPYSQEQMIMAV